MHDLIQEMGWEIVRQSTRKLGERSRLWTAEDVSTVLENNKGSEAIEGIYLPWSEAIEVHWRPDVFEEMCKLRLLKIYDARQSLDFLSYGKVKLYIDGDFKYLPNGLRYLHWERYLGKSWPLNFKPQDLVELDMPCSKLERLWDGVQKLGSLKHINLRSSLRLTEIPDLSQAPKLESINLCGCLSLIHIPSLNLQATPDESAYRHQWPRVKLGYFEFQAQRTPGSIILRDCLGLTTLPKVSGNIRKLVLSGTTLKELPSSIESLENLRILNLQLCRNLKSLPPLPRNIEGLILDYSGIEQIPSSSIECLCSLRKLSLRHCKSLSSLPSNINLKALEEPILAGTSIQELPWTIENSIGLPASIGMLYKLKELDISYCNNLQSLPELPLFIETVKAECCSSLKMVSTAEDCFSTVRSTLTLGRWLDKYDSDSDIDNYQREFSFLNCTKLGEDAINNIFTEFLYKVFCTATTPQEVVVSKRVIRKVVVCYPTKEIPGWFKNQSDGSTITIELPTNWYNPKTFLGFVVSVVVVQDEYDYEDYSSVECILHLRTDRDRFRVYDNYGYIFRSRLDHIVMWYNYFDHSEVNLEKKYEVASFEFKSLNLKVKRCGVRMLYLRDAVEKFDDGTTANFESWRIDVIDSDSASDDDFQSCGSDNDQSHES